MSDRITGQVKWWNDTKGYGFLERSDGQPDVFVHRTALPKAGADGRGARLEPGQQVTFLVVPGEKGPKAAWVETSV
jgi:cold shock protein